MSFEGTPEEIAERLNELPDGWAQQVGLRFVRASRDEVVAEVTIEARHLQPYGIVHGGVYCSIIETLASSGAALDAMRHGLSVVGLDNHTSFIRATGPGTITATAKPITRGRRSQLWEATIVDGAGKTLATGRVRLLVLEHAGIEKKGT
jgi:uncharacterized protein (TIGR00369 family)